MILIPSIDLRGGRCVRLRQGNFAAQSVYAVEPATLVERYFELGACWLHVVDLDGARDGSAVNTPLILELARHPAIRLQVGGGVRRASGVDALLAAGVARVVIGTAAAERPGEVTEWLQEFGTERICLAFDVRLDAAGKPLVRTNAWTRNSTLSLCEAIDAYPPQLLKHVLCTDIERDGMRRGPNFHLYRQCVTHFPQLKWQASGGIRDGHDLTALRSIGVAAAVSGTALLEERIAPKELRPFLPDASFPASTSAQA